jgi:predicted Zn-dependent protease
MAFLPRSVDQFLILNGLERGAALVPGQRYKIVAQ